MLSAGFERRPSRFEILGVNSELLMIDYIAAIFISYILSHFLGNIPYKMGRKMV